MKLCNRFFSVLSILILMISLFGSPISASAKTNIRLSQTNVQISVEGNLFRFAFTLESIKTTNTSQKEKQHLVVFDSSGNLVKDTSTLEKVFFTAFVYRPYFDNSGRLPKGPAGLERHHELEWKRLANQITQTTLLVREVSAKLLVNAIILAATGGSSTPKEAISIGKIIPKKTAINTIKSSMKDPAFFLEAVVSSSFESAITAWKHAETKFNQTRNNKILRYEDADLIFKNLCHAGAFGKTSGDMALKLTLRKGGGGNLQSQMTKITAFLVEELIDDVSDLYNTGALVSVGQVGHKLYGFLLDKVPDYRDYIAISHGIYSNYLNYKNNPRWVASYKSSLDYLTQQYAQQTKVGLPDLGRDGNAYPKTIITNSGKQLFVPNHGLTYGSNNIKVFGRNRTTTLWNNKRRLECYEYSIRIMAQMPMANGVDTVEQTQRLLQQIGFEAEALQDISHTINAIHTNYIKGGSFKSDLSNAISKQLRKINPKSYHGMKLHFTNLRHLGDALGVAAAAYKLADFAIGAAVQNALAGDLALGRLDLLERTLNKRAQAAVPVDEAIFKAIKRARHNLVRSEDYWLALMVELSDRKNELVQTGLGLGIKLVQKDAVKLLTKFYKAAHVKAPATKAASVAGLWGFSLMATYATIDALLEQHKKAQISVTSATMAHILKDEVNQGRAPDTDVIRKMRYQAEYTYYDQMVDAASGILPGFHDLVNYLLHKRKPYKEVKEHFESLCSKLASALETKGPASGFIASRPFQLIMVVDCSGSMKDDGKMGQAKIAVKLLSDFFVNNPLSIAAQWSQSTHSFADVALVAFNNQASTLAVLGHSKNKTDFFNLVNSLRADGGTDLGTGLGEARRLYSERNSQSEVRIILLSDGKDAGKTRERMVQELKRQKIILDTIALGGDADHELMQRIAKSTGGNYYTADNLNLAHVFTSIWARMHGLKTTMVSTGLVAQDETRVMPLTFDPGETAMIHLSWPGSKLGLKLFSREQNATSKIETVDHGHNYLIARISQLTGQFQLGVVGQKVSRPMEPFNVTVFSNKPKGVIVAPLASEYQIGEKVLFQAWIEGHDPGAVKLVVSKPSGEQRELRGRVISERGILQVVFKNTDQIGIYRASIEKNGEVLCIMAFRVGNADEVIRKGLGPASKLRWIAMQASKRFVKTGQYKDLNVFCAAKLLENLAHSIKHIMPLIFLFSDDGMGGRNFEYGSNNVLKVCSALFPRTDFTSISLVAGGKYVASTDPHLIKKKSSHNKWLNNTLVDAPGSGTNLVMPLDDKMQHYIVFKISSHKQHFASLLPKSRKGSVDWELLNARLQEHISRLLPTFIASLEEERLRSRVAFSSVQPFLEGLMKNTLPYSYFELKDRAGKIYFVDQHSRHEPMAAKDQIRDLQKVNVPILHLGEKVGYVKALVAFGP
jgi:uncharacterized protein YegL